MDHYKKYKKIEMDIFRNGKLIGYNNYFFSRKGKETIVTNQIKFSVKLLGTTIFQVEGYGEEKYIEDQLVYYDSKTLQNDKEKFVNLVFDKNKFNKIEMEIFRNGELIGYNYYFFKRNGEETTITNQLRFSVKLLGATIFQVESFGEEKYVGDQLISYKSKTLQNDKKKFTNLTYNNKSKKFDINGSSYSGEASNSSVLGNWWSHKILQADTQISPVSGSIKEQVVTFLGKEKINLYGKIYNVDHFTLKSKDMSLPKDKRLDFNIWYDQKNAMILKVSYSRMGNWEYRLKNFD